MKWSVINWLLSGDVSIQYQVHRDLLNSDRKRLRDRIATEGWGARFLEKRKADFPGKSDYIHINLEIFLIIISLL